MTLDISQNDHTEGALAGLVVVIGELYALVDVPPAALTPTLVQGSVGLGPALVVGVVFGVVGALAGELSQRILYAHAETHLDPPAASIVLTSLLLGVLSMAGVLPSAVWVPTPL